MHFDLHTPANFALASVDWGGAAPLRVRSMLMPRQYVELVIQQGYAAEG